ncbi:MAG: alpha/beta fold hydrolase [Actinobacteria bacterium]|nr:alpha/beta fold hydrolase [Actinomycetota bacterium]
MSAGPNPLSMRSARVVNRLRRGGHETGRQTPTDEVIMRPVQSPHWLPPGRALELPGRGTTWIHEMQGPGRLPASRVHAGEPTEPPTLFLLHGWTATGALNWFPAFHALGGSYRVITIDHRGHGRGIRSRRRFRLEDCADDVVAAADELGIESFIPVGYSMGGPIAQLTWRRHRDRVDGLVLCATARNFTGRPGEKALFGVMASLAIAARLTPGSLQRQMTERVLLEKFEDSAEGRWAADEMRHHDPRMIVEAGQAIGRFSSHQWIGGVDVPTACVVTEFDAVVPPHRQRRLAASIAGATVHPVRGDHTVCVVRPQNFVPVLVEACDSVTTRIERRSRAAG